MALISPAWGIQGGSHDAKAVRQVLAASFGAPVQAFSGGIQPTDGGGAHGVIGDDDLKVTQTGTPGMKVNIAAGSAVVTGTSVLAEGALAFVNDADLEVTISVGDATHDRKDLICIQKQENVLDASGQDRVRALVVAGTPSATPSDPAVPAGCMVLARVTVAANEATSITDSDITDLRTYAAAFGGVLRCTSATRPTGVSLYTGLRIYELDTGAEHIWSGSAWLNVLPATHINSGATAAAGWSITSFDAYVTAVDITMSIVMERTGSAITVPSSGDIGNTLVITLPASCQGSIAAGMPLATGASGRVVATNYNPSNGSIYLTAAGGGGSNINTSDAISFGGNARINP